MAEAEILGLMVEAEIMAGEITQMNNIKFLH